MNKFPPELIYIVIMVAFVLFQYVMKRYGPKKLPAQPDQSEELAGNSVESPAAPASGEVVACMARAETFHGSPVLAGRRFSRKSLMGCRRATQNAIAVSTILGPCRAFEPYDVS